MARFYEFFAGGGMVRAGLGPNWSCLFANDIDPAKCASYERNWGATGLRIADVASLTAEDLPGTADLAWASFPCQDLSLAGSGGGLKGERSGTFWPFWSTVEGLAAAGRAPSTVVLENVCGALTSHRGEDFAEIGGAIESVGYRFGAVVIDAVHFVPQSRPRLFVIGIHRNQVIPDRLVSREPDQQWHTRALVEAYRRLAGRSRANWLWWHVPTPPEREAVLSDLIEEDPRGVKWHTAAETRRLLRLMNPVHLAKVAAAKEAGHRVVGTVYKRTRPDKNGVGKQRAEVRFDDIAGCLRTPSGGSSRQTVMIVEGSKVRSRLLAPREAARLMGLPDDYKLPENYNDAYHLAGDGVVVPVVRHLAEFILEPLLAAFGTAERKAA
ncbi:MAG: DNA cytosine methyltransferase [Gemmatimonadota bacterium]|nr:DNA cytosine methyltransferase [Gemmatimonadota bacterium]